MKPDRKKIHQKFNGHCAYCGKEITIKEMQVDHIKPKSMRVENMVLFEGVMIDETDLISNLYPSCRRCNHYKRALTVDGKYGFRYLIETLHERVESDYITKVAIDFRIVEIKEWDGLFYFEKIKQ